MSVLGISYQGDLKGAWCEQAEVPITRNGQALFIMKPKHVALSKCGIGALLTLGARKLNLISNTSIVLAACMKTTLLPISCDPVSKASALRIQTGAFLSAWLLGAFYNTHSIEGKAFYMITAGSAFQTLPYSTEFLLLTKTITLFIIEQWWDRPSKTDSTTQE